MPPIPRWPFLHRRIVQSPASGRFKTNPRRRLIFRPHRNREPRNSRLLERQMSTNAARAWTAVRLSDEETVAARTFYCDVLGGRQVWRVERADGAAGLFCIGNH